MVERGAGVTPADLPILFADPHYVVLNKPAGLAVHPGPAGGPSVEDWFPLLSKRRDGPWLAHRLDADTAGCLVVALRKAPLLAAQAEFAAHRAHKIYWAVVEGEPEADFGVIEAKLLKRPDRGGWRMVVDPAGQAAVTQWRVLGRSPGRAWLELSPRTGRTHQLRVHCALMGWPILGDARYGNGDDLHLLARSIRLELTPPLQVVAPPPPAMVPALVACGYQPLGSAS
jgi:tRNA pseudouridine32 synthase/23S rRNA pseudouridine746 synthase